MNLQGDFEGQNLTGIFQMLCNDQNTGFLRVTSEDKESRVYFDRGTVVYAKSSLKKARLGFLMIAEGIITGKQLKECLAFANASKVSLGKVLVEKGHISTEILKKYITKQVEEIIYNLLLWKKGKFEYRDAQLNLKGMIGTQLNPMKLILEASRRMDEMSVIYEAIPSDRIVFRIASKVDQKEEFKLNANEWKVLSLIDGNRMVRHLVEDSGYDEFAVYKILFTVISYGLIEKKEEVQLKDGEHPHDINAIVTIFQDIFEAILKSAQVELGTQAEYLFDESKFGLGPPHKDILEGYHPRHDKTVNILSVSEAMKKTQEPLARFSLIEAFSQYCIHVLKRIKDILGSYPLNRIINDIENVLEYIKKYQNGSSTKTKIISSMKEVIDEVTSG
ncbi:MAG: DUF4388 domain-containing protein [Desulfobacteraceae bacterium]|nr:MAG: DUF4388 domain-containing protein [Desulfobacteraceae bacterium]